MKALSIGQPTAGADWSAVFAGNAINVINNARDRRVAAKAEQEVRALIKAVAPQDVPPLNASEENGAIVVEWILRRRRIGITIAPESADSGWHYVSASEFLVGSLDDLDVDALVRKALTVS